MDEIPEILLSIVIPVKNNGSTIAGKIKNVLNCINRQCEIIVIDNASNDGSLKVYQHFENINSLRIIKFEEPVSMSKNWERGLKYCSGSFVTYLGGDDGYNIGGFKRLLKFLNSERDYPVAWGKIGYRWPWFDGTSKNGSFRFRSAARAQHSILDSLEVLQQILSNLDVNYLKLPSIYNSAVPRDIIEDIIRSDGRFFNAQTPDVYSGLRVCLATQKYTFLPFTVGISGVSSQSNGIATFKAQANEVANNFNFYNKKDGNEFNQCLPQIHSLPTCITDSYEKIFDRAKGVNLKELPKISLANFLRKVEEHLISNGLEKGEYGKVLLRTNSLIADEKTLADIFDTSLEFDFIVTDKTNGQNIFLRSKHAIGNFLLIGVNSRFYEIDVSTKYLQKFFIFINLFSDLWIFLE